MKINKFQINNGSFIVFYEFNRKNDFIEPFLNLVIKLFYNQYTKDITKYFFTKGKHSYLKLSGDLSNDHHRHFIKEFEKEISFLFNTEIKNINSKKIYKLMDE